MPRGARGANFFFSNMVVTNQIDEDDKQYRLRVKYSPKGQAGDLGVRSNSIKFWLPCQFQRFLYQTFINLVCVLTNERYKTYQTRFSLCDLGHVPGVGLWGIGGAQGGQFFFKHGHVVYQIDRDGEQNIMQVKFSS